MRRPCKALPRGCQYQKKIGEPKRYGTLLAFGTDEYVDEGVFPVAIIEDDETHDLVSVPVGQVTL